MKQALRALLLAGLVGLILGGCRRHESVAEAAKRTNTLILGNLAEPEDLDPQVVTSYTDINVTLALFEGLTAVDEVTSQATPAAAETWNVSADGLTWTFHLRAGLTWSNGEALTADDFIQSWRRMLSPELAAEYSYLLYPIKGAEAFNTGKTKDVSLLGISAPDPRTVQIVLERPTPYLPILVSCSAWFPVNMRVLAKFDALKRRGTAWTKPGNLVGNGPFVLKTWSPNDKIVVERNPGYWDAGANALNRVIFRPTESPEVEEHDFRAGQVHITYALPATKIAVYRQNHPAELRIDPFLQTFFLRFNVTKKPFGDTRVRQALSFAIDREAISHAVLMEAFPPAYSLTPPGTGGYTARAHWEKLRRGPTAPGRGRIPGRQGLPGHRGAGEERRDSA